MPSSRETGDLYRVINDELTGGILAYVEANYRVFADRGNRAIGGFSRGGRQSLIAALNNPGRFALIGFYAASLTPEVCDEYFWRSREFGGLKHG